jgi:hypothetical protein
MNQKKVIAILGVVAVILAGTTIYFATINKASQSVAPAPKVVQQPAQPIPSQQQVANNPTPENVKPVLDKKVLQDTVFSAVDSALKAKYQSTKDPGYAVWDKKVDVTTIDVSQKAAKGKWWAKDAWDWIAWQQDDGSWKVLVSFDGFNCKELNSVPSQYAAFFKDVTYPTGKKYCY